MITYLCGLLVIHGGNSFNVRGQDVSTMVMTQEWFEAVLNMIKMVCYESSGVFFPWGDWGSPHLAKIF